MNYQRTFEESEQQAIGSSWRNLLELLTHEVSEDLVPLINE